jgi:hypothetical protein
MRNKPILFQNPVDTILNNPRFKKTTQGIIVEGDVRGEVITLITSSKDF